CRHALKHSRDDGKSQRIVLRGSWCVEACGGSPCLTERATRNTFSPMQRLEPPDLHYLNAAIGWLGLGRRDDAKAELEMISAPNQRHPDVLEARWAIYAEERQWEAALDVARKLLRRAPHRVSGWLHQAYALRRAPEGGLEKAWAALKPAVEKFPT